MDDDARGVDEMINDAERLIQSVYNDMDRDNLERRLSRYSLPKTPRRSTNCSTAISPIVAANIAHINNVVSTVEENLRNIESQAHRRRPRRRASNAISEGDCDIATAPVTCQSNAGSISNSNRPTNRQQLTARRRPSTNAGSVSNPDDVNFITANKNTMAGNNRNRLTTNQPIVIDLSNASQILEEDDDVVIVASNLTEVIDLSTPTRVTTVPRNHTLVVPERSSGLFQRAVNNNRNRSRSPAQTSAQTSTTNIIHSNNNHNRASVPTLSQSSTHSITCKSDTNTCGSDILTCPVCMDGIRRNRPTTTKCGHLFCENCIKAAVRMTKKCPMCNTKLNSHGIFRVYL